MEQRRVPHPDPCALRSNAGPEMRASRQTSPALQFELLVPNTKPASQDQEFKPAVILHCHVGAGGPIFEPDLLVTIVEQDSCGDCTPPRGGSATFAGLPNDLHVVARSELPKADEDGAAVA